MNLPTSVAERVKSEKKGCLLGFKPLGFGCRNT
jgi:hypothetical protein